MRQSKEPGKERKQRKHNFLNKHTIAGVIVLMFGGFIIIEGAVGMSIAVFLKKTMGASTESGLGIGAMIGCAIVLILWFRYWSPEYKWKLLQGDWMKTWKLMMPPMLVFWVLLFGMFAICAKGFPFALVGVSGILEAIMAGTAEEVAFREIGLSYLARQWRDERKIIPMAMIPAVAFSLIHVGNLVQDWALTDGLIQIMLTLFFGVFFSAVYLRTGNIWMLIIMHSLHDILATSAGNRLDALGMGLPDWITAVICLIELFLCICGIYMLRKSKRAEIIALWDRKWSRETEE
jgi:membrane protease YdiL (CAAX protease family)